MGVEGERLVPLFAPAPADGGGALPSACASLGEMMRSLHRWMPTTSFPMEPTFMEGLGSVRAPSSMGLIPRCELLGGKRPPAASSKGFVKPEPSDCPRSRGDTMLGP